MSSGNGRSTTVVGGLTLTSRILGLLREVVFARFFGAGTGMDVFIVAFQIPNFLRRLFAEGAFSQAFVPVLSGYRSGKSHDDVKLADRVAGTLGLALFIITALGVVGSPILIWIFSSGFAAEPGKFDLAVDMLRITFPYLFFISLTAFAGGILNAYDRFGPPAFTPVLLNVCLIAATLWIAPQLERPAIGLAWGVFVAGAVQLLFQFPFLIRIGIFPRPRLGFGHPGVRKIMLLMLPAVFAASAAQINLLVDRHIASYLETGSISWLYFSDRLLEFPLGVFAIALGTVILPGLSRNHAGNESQQFSRTLDWALRWVAVIAAPAAVGLLVLAGPMLSTLFQYGEFGAHDVVMARYSLVAYAVGLVGFSLVKVLVPGYFSRQDTRTPVRYGVTAMVVNVIANFALVIPMMRAGFVAPHLGLALATSLAAWVNALLLLRGLKRAGVYQARGGWGALFVRVTIALIAMGIMLYFAQGALSSWVVAGWQDRVLRLTVLIGAGTLVYFGALAIVGVRPAELRAPKTPPSV